MEKKNYFKILSLGLIIGFNLELNAEINYSNYLNNTEIEKPLSWARQVDLDDVKVEEAAKEQKRKNEIRKSLDDGKKIKSYSMYGEGLESEVEARYKQEIDELERLERNKIKKNLKNINNENRKTAKNNVKSIKGDEITLKIQELEKIPTGKLTSIQKIELELLKDKQLSYGDRIKNKWNNFKFKDSMNSIIDKIKKTYSGEIKPGQKLVPELVESFGEKNITIMASIGIIAFTGGVYYWIANKKETLQKLAAENEKAASEKAALEKAALEKAASEKAASEKNKKKWTGKDYARYGLGAAAAVGAIGAGVHAYKGINKKGVKGYFKDLGSKLARTFGKK